MLFPPFLTSLSAGVRSHQAKKVLQSMRAGDRAFFYHSNAKPPGIVGIVEVGVLLDYTTMRLGRRRAAAERADRDCDTCLTPGSRACCACCAGGARGVP